MTRIKICGITNLDDARCAAAAGADFLGFIFYPQSPRYIAPRTAAAIAIALRAELGLARPRLAGIFVDAPVDVIRDTFDQVKLDLIQLHGEEPPSTVASLQPFAVKALRPHSLEGAASALWDYARISAASSGSVLDDRPQLLIDAYHPLQKGGTGERADITIARWLAARCSIMLAGGLTPENVAGAIADVHPWGVDVSSGVEQQKGLKDHTRVRAFVQAVRYAEKDEALDAG